MTQTRVCSPTSVDLTAIGRRDFRERIRHALDEIEGAGAVSELQDFWPRFLELGTVGAERPTLVVGYLAPMIQRFRSVGVHQWTTSVRRSRCYFVTFVRTDRDRRYAPWVDDLVKASDLRVNVCNDSADWSHVTRCLRAGVSALRPDALLNVRCLPAEEKLWLLFGDGLTGSIGLGEIGLGTRGQELVLESATAAELGSALELTTVSGELFEVDAASLRALLDKSLREDLSETAQTSQNSLGSGLRAKRERAGLTQVELGERSGLDQAVVSRIERGRVRPRIDTLRLIAQALDMSVGRLLSR